MGLDLEILRRLSGDRLVQVLEDAVGAKDLVIDAVIMKSMDRIADVKLLRNHGVDKIYSLDRLPPPIPASLQRVYIVQNSMVTIKYVVDHTNADCASHPDLKVRLIVMPRITSWITQLIEEEGLYGRIALNEFCPEFIPIDEDLLSLELNSFFRQVYLEGNFSDCVPVARCLHTLQGLYGRIPNVICQGRAAKVVKENLDRLENAAGGRKPNAERSQPEISHLLIMDRSVDLVTPLLTPLVYEAALDDHFGISAGVIEFPPNVADQPTSLKLPLNTADTVYQNVRYSHLATVSGFLIARAREVGGKREGLQGMTTSQMKEFVETELRTLQSVQKSLTLHLSAFETITKRTAQTIEAQLQVEHGLLTGAASASEATTHLEDCLARQLPLTTCLRLLCLLSLTQEGLGRSEYHSLAGQLCASHGYNQLLSLHHLQQAGLLLLKDSNVGGVKLPEKNNIQRPTSLISRSPKLTGWPLTAKQLHLLPNSEVNVDLRSPQCVSYVFNGAYIPAVARIAASLFESTQNSLSIIDSLKSLPGPTIISQPTTPASGAATRVVLVLVLGGLTFTEVAALRWVALSMSVRIVIACTNTVTGCGLMRSLLPL